MFRDSCLEVLELRLLLLSDFEVAASSSTLTHPPGRSFGKDQLAPEVYAMVYSTGVLYTRALWHLSRVVECSDEVRRLPRSCHAGNHSECRGLYAATRSGRGTTSKRLGKRSANLPDSRASTRGASNVALNLKARASKCKAQLALHLVFITRTVDCRVNYLRL